MTVHTFAPAGTNLHPRLKRNGRGRDFVVAGVLELIRLCGALHRPGNPNGRPWELVFGTETMNAWRQLP